MEAMPVIPAEAIRPVTDEDLARWEEIKSRAIEIAKEVLRDGS